MTNRILTFCALGFVAVICASPHTVVGQQRATAPAAAAPPAPAAPAAKAPAAKVPYVPPKTAWGEPDV